MLKKIKNFFSYPISDYKFDYKKLNPKNYNWEAIKKGLKVFVIFITGVALTVFTFDLIYFDFMGAEEESADNIASQVIDHLDSYYFTPGDVQVGCNLKVINLHGDLVTHIPEQDISADGTLLYDETASDSIVREIRDAESNDNIKAIVIDIDSQGGYAVAGEEVANALKRAVKPTVAVIRETGASAAYYAATGADYIFASKHSDVGSIGVTYSYVDNAKQNQQEGLTYNQISLGKFKDAGDPNKPLTAEERELFMRDAGIVQENFIKDVAANRKLDIEQVRKLADGSSFLGEMALKNGLIDKIGSAEEAKEYLQEMTGEEMIACE